ncbi:MAG: GldG family protein [Pseudobdellovibrionaceae bacterium]|nr:GldG family protein [Bdellovibrionales bacterium]USN48872.1 MAG: GldG family protein [Pseudobdellovibrionaceae bacterium]
MSRWGTISWLVCGLSLVIVVVARYILGGWHDFLWAPLVIGLLTFIAAFVVDFRFYLEFLTMRTTKSGMNMGLMIVLALVLIVSVNVLSLRHNKTFDMTEEKINSLADQTLSVLKGLKEDLTVKVFYLDEKDQQNKQAVKGLVEQYQENSNKVKIQFVNAYVNQAEAQEYLKRGDRFAVFVEYKGRKVRVEEPNSERAEEKFTSAIVKATRDKVKKVYFLTGHGERSYDSQDTQGMQEFKTLLEDASFEVAKLNLLKGEDIPEDASIIAIVGPDGQILDSEIAALTSWAKKGGKLFIAADPGLRHGINRLTENLGVHFDDKYILNVRTVVAGGSPATVLGTIYDKAHPITDKLQMNPFRPFEDQITLFDVASSLTKSAGDSTPGQKVVELVKTSPSTFSSPDLRPQPGTKVERESFVLGMAVEWDTAEAAKDAEEAKEKPTEVIKTAAVVFGDSDFLNSRNIFVGYNRDIAMNSIAFLGEESDLISIRPKVPKGTTLKLTSSSQRVAVIAGLSLPLLLLIASGFAWQRRRSA